MQRLVLGASETASSGDALGQVGQMTYPLTTVIVNSYNRPRLIRDALDSILAQTWPNIQIIVADDWSDKPLCDVMREYELQFPSFIVPGKAPPTAHERQYGQRCSVCINAAMPYAKGEFVVFLPDDDFLTPRSIEVRAQYLVDHPEVNAVYGRLEACKSERPMVGIHWKGEGEHYAPIKYVHPSGNILGICEHDRKGFWSAEPIVRGANRLDHSMPMFRRWWTDKYGEPHPLPIWPEYRTDEVIINGESQESPYPPSDLDRFIRTNGERFDCPDAGFFFRLELAGLGPFHSVDEVVTVKRYHSMHHRTDPSRRE